MKKGVLSLFIIWLFVLSCSFTAIAIDEDVKGGKDHPILSRMPDFYISTYEYKDFDSYRFNDKDKKYVTVEGTKYYIEYKLKKGAIEPGELKIRKNIQNALEKIGGKVVFNDNFNKNTTMVLIKDGREIWVEVKSYASMYRLTIVEKKIMDQHVVANAEMMKNDINATGHIAIYGIYFDSGKADIKPESEAAIAEIAKLLNTSKDLKLEVVGHTDNVGSFDFGMKLSKDRADAVVKVLVEKYGISPSRLRAHGVASLAPVASNDTEEGRAKNRRVELVKQ